MYLAEGLLLAGALYIWGRDWMTSVLFTAAGALILLGLTQMFMWRRAIRRARRIVRERESR